MNITRLGVDILIAKSVFHLPCVDRTLQPYGLSNRNDRSRDAGGASR